MNALRGKVVVITGASSGVGREAALQFSERGCAVVLAARREGELEKTARECLAAGGDPRTVVTDVTREEDVRNLAAQALQEWGRIDIWINNAGVTLFAPLEDGAFEEHRRVIETNLYGAMFGARAVLPIFKRQGHGTLINVGSILSKVGQAFVPSYVISKFGLRGLSEALRVELADEADIHVCTLLPYAIDTPHFESGANAMGRQAHAMPPVQSPEKVARALVQLAERPRRELHVPRFAPLGFLLHWMAPRTTERLLLHALQTWHFGSDYQVARAGNLYEPAAQPGAGHGSRGPRVGTAGFLGWAALELAKIEREAVSRGLQRWGARATA